MLDLAKMSGVNANGLAYGTALAQSVYSVPKRTLNYTKLPVHFHSGNVVHFNTGSNTSSCNISISTVSFYANRFKSSGITYGDFVSLTDEEIKIRLFLKLPKEPKKVMPEIKSLTA